MPIQHNGCLAHICNVATIFVQKHVKYVYGDIEVDTWFETQLKLYYI